MLCINKKTNAIIILRKAFDHNRTKISDKSTDADENRDEINDYINNKVDEEDDLCTSDSALITLQDCCRLGEI